MRQLVDAVGADQPVADVAARLGMLGAPVDAIEPLHADLAALDATEARELVVDAWRMVVPQKVSAAYDLTHPDGPG